MTPEAAVSTRERAVALRGELWQRHVSLRDIRPGGDDYDEAVEELVELTTALLEAEAEAKTRAAHRRPARIGPVLSYLLAALCVTGAVLVGLFAPALAPGTRWVLVGLLAAAALAAALLPLRRTGAERSAPEDGRAGA